MYYCQVPPFFIRNRTHFEMNTIHRIELFNYSWRLASGSERVAQKVKLGACWQHNGTTAVTEWEIAITWVARLGQFPLLILISLLNGSNLIWKTNSTHNKPLGDHLEVASNHLLATDRHSLAFIGRHSLIVSRLTAARWQLLHRISPQSWAHWSDFKPLEDLKTSGWSSGAYRSPRGPQVT